MENSSSRILTTHVDSLVRPPEIRGLMRGKEFGQEYDREELARGVRSGVGEVVQRQLAESIGIPSDGEYGKSEFSAYVTECLRVLNPVPRTRTRAFYSIGAGPVNISRIISGIRPDGRERIRRAGRLHRTNHLPRPSGCADLTVS